MPVAGVDSGEEAVVAADDERAAARHEGQADGPAPLGTTREARELPQRRDVDQADGPVAVPDGEDPAVRADGVATRASDAGRRIVVRRRERAPEAAVAGEIPDEDLAVEAASCRASGRRG